MSPTRALTLAAVYSMLSLASCSGSDSTTAPEPTANTAPTTAVAPPSSQDDNATSQREEAIKLQRARARARARAVAGVVRDYYENLDAKDLDAAWARLSPGVQAQLGGHDTWAAGQEGTVDVTVGSVHTARVSKTSAVVAVALRSTSVDICSRTVHQRFAGTWTLSRAGGRWVASSLHIEKTGGGTERTDYTQCDDSSGTNTSPEGSAPAEPDYTPVDPSEPDPGAEEDPGFCDTHDCIPNFDNGNGSVVQCADGTYSHSGGIQGACSHHGGVG